MLGCSIVALKVATIEGTSDDYLLGLEERTLCRLKKVSVKAQVLGIYAHRANTRTITAAKTIKDAYSNASFSRVTATTESLRLSGNGFKTV